MLSKIEPRKRGSINTYEDRSPEGGFYECPSYGIGFKVQGFRFMVLMSWGVVAYIELNLKP